MNIIISSLLDINNSAQNRVHHFVSHLSDEHTIYIISPRDTWRESHADVEEYSSNQLSDLDNVNIIYLSNENWLPPTIQETISELLLYKNIEIHFSKIDAHLDYNSLFLGYAVQRRLSNYDVPMVYDLADNLPAMIRESPQIPALLQPVGGQIGELMINKKMQKASSVSYVTESVKQDTQIPDSKSVHVPNGVNTDTFSPDIEPNYPETANEEFIIGYVGVTREWVDLQRLIQVVDILRKDGEDVGAIIVGSEGGIEQTKKEAQKRGILEHIHFTGTVPYEQVPAYINSFDVGTIPFKQGNIAKHSLPLKLFEYMSCEIPVVSSSIPGVKSVAGDIVKFADNTSELVIAAEQLATKPKYREELGTRGRQLVKGNHSWHAIGNQIETLLSTNKL